MWILIVSVWLLFGILGAGWCFAYFQSMWPYTAKENFREDLGFAILFSILGPFFAIMSFLLSGFGKYGWRLWTKKTSTALTD